MDGDIAVMMAASLDTARAFGMQPPYVVVTPDHNNWNDYGRRFFATLHVVATADQVHEMYFYMMLEGRGDTAVALTEMLGPNSVLPLEAIEIPFVSLIPDRDQYGVLIAALGFVEGIVALRKLNDAVVARVEGSPQQVLDLAGTEEFAVGVLRRHGALNALRRGAMHFTPYPRQSGEDAAVRTVFSSQSKSADNIVPLDLDFIEKPVIRDRIAVLVGKNGVGKTQMLNAMVSALVTDRSLDQTTVAQANFSPPLQASRVLVFSSVPTDPFPRSIGAWHGIDYEYFAVNAVKDVGRNSLIEALVACRFEDAPDLVRDDDSFSRLDVIKRALRSLGLWQRLCLPIAAQGNSENMSRIVDGDGNKYVLISTRYNELNTLRLLRLIDWSRSPVVIDDQFAPRALSSGEFAMLRFAAQAAAAIEQGSLVLLDEPETHLHPNYISDMMEVLYELLEATQSVAVIATHSAYVVREVSRENVKVVSVTDRVMSIGRPRLQTFGASVDSISQFIFGDGDQDHHFEAVLKRWAKEKGRAIGLDGIIAEYGTTLNPESLSLIAAVLEEGDAE